MFRAFNTVAMARGAIPLGLLTIQAGLAGWAAETSIGTELPPERSPMVSRRFERAAKRRILRRGFVDMDSKSGMALLAGVLLFAAGADAFAQGVGTGTIRPGISARTVPRGAYAAEHPGQPGDRAWPRPNGIADAARHSWHAWKAVGSGREPQRREA